MALENTYIDVVASSFEPISAFQVISLSELNAGARTRTYKRRRAHEKTRSGCLVCKEKRVKCDELQPSCTRCQRNSWPCKYKRDKDADEDETGIKTSVVNWNAAPKICLLDGVTISPFPSARNGTSNQRLLHHFNGHWNDILQIPRSEVIISLSRSSPLVSACILALSASHLRHVTPGLQHRVAEHFQSSIAIENILGMLKTSKGKLGQADVHALLFSGFLLNILAFTVPASESEESGLASSFVFSTRENSLGWLTLQAGLRPLLLSMAAYIQNTMQFLGPVLLGEKEDWVFMNVGDGSAMVPSKWIEFFGLTNDRETGCDKTSTAAHDVYRAPVILLARLREVAPQRRNVFKNIPFLSKVDRDFRALLHKKDEKALWIFGFWLGLMCRYESIWWCDESSRREYHSICVFLEQLKLDQRPGNEGKVWAAMLEELYSASNIKSFSEPGRK